MNHAYDLRIVFPTSFSDACFRMSGAIAQLADRYRIDLTVVHVIKPGTSTASARRELDSFMGEADSYDNCRRLLVESEDPVSAIAKICREQNADLIACPASDRLGFRRFFTHSFRARLLQHCRTPLWTAGACLDKANFRNNVRTISCLVDLENSGDAHLWLAMALASRMGARVRVTHVIEPVHEGMLARSIDSRSPLLPEAALARIQKVFAGKPCPEIDVAVGDPASELPRLLRRCEADLAFTGPGHSLQGSTLLRLSSWVDKLPCPVICVDGGSAAFRDWTFEKNAADAARAETLRLLEDVREFALAG